MGRSTEGRAGLSEQRKYRTFTAQKKLEIVLAGLRGDRSVREVCREHAISETLFYGWRFSVETGLAHRPSASNRLGIIAHRRCQDFAIRLAKRTGEGQTSRAVWRRGAIIAVLL